MFHGGGFFPPHNPFSLGKWDECTHLGTSMEAKLACSGDAFINLLDFDVSVPSVGRRIIHTTMIWIQPKFGMRYPCNHGRFKLDPLKSKESSFLLVLSYTPGLPCFLPVLVMFIHSLEFKTQH